MACHRQWRGRTARTTRYRTLGRLAPAQLLHGDNLTYHLVSPQSLLHLHAHASLNSSAIAVQQYVGKGWTAVGKAITDALKQ